MSTATKDTVTVTFDPTSINKQADIISAATAQRAGVMTTEQVKKLEEGGTNCCPSVTDVKNSNYTAVELEVVQCVADLGPFSVTFPAITPANKDKMISVWVSPEFGNVVTILPTGSDTINTGPSEALASGAMGFISNGVDNWLKLY
jgi:hypothetical protein